MQTKPGFELSWGDISLAEMDSDCISQFLCAGLQWDNMYKSPMIGDNTSFGWMCWLILIDSFIYFILGWYIRNVFPGKDAKH